MQFPDHWLFHLVDDADRRALAKNSITRKYTRDEQIVRAMDTDADLYLVVEGRVRVTLFTSTGREISFVDIEAGGNFGEFAAIDGEPRSADVIALIPSTIIIVPRAEFMRLLETYPQVWMELLRQLVQIARRLCDRIYEYSTLNAGQRVMLELSRMASLNMDLDGVARIRNPPTHAEIASRVSCVREAVSRALNVLHNEGVVSRESRMLVVHDYRRLQDMVEAGP